MDREESRIAKPHPDTAESYGFLWSLAGVFAIAAFAALRLRPEPAMVGAAAGVIGAMTAGFYAAALGLSGRRQRLAAYGFQYGMVFFSAATAFFMAINAGPLARGEPPCAC